MTVLTKKFDEDIGGSCAMRRIVVGNHVFVRYVPVDNPSRITG